MTHFNHSPRRWRAPLAVLALAVCGLLPLPGLATQPLHQNLTKMIAAADLVVSGTVSRVSDGIEAGVAFTEVTLKVKGSVRRQLESGGDFTFRQWGLLKARRMADGRWLLPMQIQGMPTWRVGEQVVVFLNPPASATGLRSPVGLNQGKFTSMDGRVTNGTGNVSLFEGVSVAAPLSADESALLARPLGPVDEATLMNLVERAVQGQWIETGVMR